MRCCHATVAASPAWPLRALGRACYVSASALCFSGIGRDAQPGLCDLHLHTPLCRRHVLQACTPTHRFGWYSSSTCGLGGQISLNQIRRAPKARNHTRTTGLGWLHTTTGYDATRHDTRRSPTQLPTPEPPSRIAHGDTAPAVPPLSTPRAHLDVDGSSP